MTSSALISIVDDDESIRDALGKLLRSFGFTAQAFASGADFLASPVSSATDCILLDVCMPDMSGPDVHQELKRRKITTPVIFITARGNEAIRDRALAAGAAAYLNKPFEPSVIVASIEAALAKP